MSVETPSSLIEQNSLEKSVQEKVLGRIGPILRAEELLLHYREGATEFDFEDGIFIIGEEKQVEILKYIDAMCYVGPYEIAMIDVVPFYAPNEEGRQDILVSALLTEVLPFKNKDIFELHSDIDVLITCDSREALVEIAKRLMGNAMYESLLNPFPYAISISDEDGTEKVEIHHLLRYVGEYPEIAKTSKIFRERGITGPYSGTFHLRE
ncbi:MAG: hypothetical protein WCY00_00255 [Candidatus Dojkabacteria bacterium]|jgi:hypothetical protein